MDRMKWLVLAACFLNLQPGFAKERPSQLPLLVIGGSYANGNTPFNNGIAPVGGIAVNFGSYLSIGSALVKNEKLPGFVINEGQAGATTFARLQCGPLACTAAGWESFQTMFDKALKRVTTPATNQHNAKYLLMIGANDCLHPGAFGIPQSQAVQCTLADMNAAVDRLISVANSAVSNGLTPLYLPHPEYRYLDLPLFQAANNFAWVISEQDYNQLRSLYIQRLSSEVPEAILLTKAWGHFRHLGDGVHPTPETAKKTAERIATKLLQLD